MQHDLKKVIVQLNGHDACLVINDYRDRFNEAVSFSIHVHLSFGILTRF